ncbi:hypothetical protein NHL50_09795 [Acidimicrobiia bacterium EGI L10123]|uniref:hypothetical protein n=1 Tax=Salinilacustrithrix flava TaxID=2957203 RepID=UPI003D7C26D5|nr:hypothetical protein [Acidimicrobiia bacterium EGI L10123]
MGDRIRSRELMVDPSAFGRVPDSPWLKPESAEELGVLIAAYWHHLAVCTLNAMFVEPEVELSRRLGVANDPYLRGQLVGRYRVSIEDLCTWAIALGDVSLLPELHSADDLLPPGVTRADLSFLH